MKKVLTLAIAAALVAPVAAMADTTIYGKVRQAVDMVDYDAPGNANDIDEFQINDKTSRLGFKGSEDLGNGLTAVYQFEFGVNISGGGNGYDDSDDSEFSGGSWSHRNAFVGLAGGFGTFVVGRHDTPLKISTGALDYFGDTVVDNNNSYTESLTDRRANGTLAYISPSFGGVTLAAAIVPGENTSATGGAADGIMDAVSLAAMYSNGGIYASAAYEGADGNITDIGADKADLTQYRLGGGYDAGMWKVAGVYESLTVDNPAGGTDLFDVATMNINGGIKVGNGMILAKWFDYEDDSNKTNNHDGFGLGYHHSLSARTQLMANYVDSSYGDNGADTDVSVLSFQINHSF